MNAEERLAERVDLIACQVLGHDFGPWREYTYTRLAPVGKTFRWRECKRCEGTTDGDKPSADSAMSEAIMDVYSDDVLRGMTISGMSVLTRALKNGRVKGRLSEQPE